MISVSDLMNTMRMIIQNLEVFNITSPDQVYIIVASECILGNVIGEKDL